MLTEEDIKILSAQTVETLARWANALNIWEWPKELPDEELPETYKTFILIEGGPGVRHSRRGEIMTWIEERVSLKYISRLWNHDMSDEEFNDFWRGHYEGDEEAEKRDRARRKALVARRLSNFAKESWPEYLYLADEWADEING